ncbi:MAG: ATP-binding protein [Christensenellales bacterium]|jgi:serine/threonine-protein kinase RsbT
MSNELRFEFEVDGGNFASAGCATEKIRHTLKQLGVAPELIRKVAISMYEGEINMVIHANGGRAIVKIDEKEVLIVLEDKGPGIADVELAMQEGYSTAPDNIRSLGFGAGMGLCNMKKYSDEMVIDTKVGEGTTVTMKVRLS